MALKKTKKPARKTQVFRVMGFFPCEPCQRVTVLSELNGLAKKLNKSKLREFQEKAAQNSRLVIGGRGAWNKLLDPIVIEEFGLGINNHDITSFASLLRMIRNILQHPESKGTMMAVCGMLEPSSEEI